MASLIPETAKKFLHTTETLVSAAKQSEGIHIVPLRLRRAIKRYLQEQEKPNMRRKVLCLSESFNKIKDANLQLTASTSRELVENPFKGIDRSKRWKIKSAYGDIGFKYRDDQTIAYVASRMPAVYSACHRVLKEVRRRLPGFEPKRVLDFGSGTGSVLWAVREVWPRSLERINLVEPSKSMQRVGQSLLRGLKDMPHIQSYDSLQSLMQNVDKSERKHDLVMASYVLGEVASLKDRITIARQLWDLTQDVLVLVEPGTPQGYSIIAQMRSHILWMEKRKCRKSKVVNETSKEMVVSNSKLGAYVVAPCPHDGRCPLENTGKYCHFVQRLQRTSSQRLYKRSKGEPLRGFEDEKFCFVALRRGQRPSEPWPLDGMKFETLKEQRAKRTPEDLEIDNEDQAASDDEDEVVGYKDPVSYDSDTIETDIMDGVEEESDDEDEVVRYKHPVSYDSDTIETDIMDGVEEEVEEEEPAAHADLGSGWGRIVFTPVRRGRQVKLDVCRSIKQDGSEGAFERVVVTQSKNPALHKQARRSLWGDLWPYTSKPDDSLG